MSDTAEQKILYLITKANFGGAQRYVYDISTSAQSYDFDVLVIYGSSGLLTEYLDRANIKHQEVPELLNRMFSPIRDFIAIKKLVTLFKHERPSVVHLNSSKAGALGALSARIAGVPKIIFTAHGWAWGEDRSFVQKIFIRFSSWITALLCHDVIAVSEYDKKQAGWMPMVQKKITVVHNGTTLQESRDRVSARKALLRRVKNENPLQKTGLGGAKSLWIGVGSELTKNKGLSYLLEALGSLKMRLDENGPWTCMILGDGQLREQLQKMAESYNLEERVSFLGYVPEASQYFKAFDIFVLPSIKEGLPYAILEAGLSDCSVVASHVGGIPEIISDMVSGILVRPKDSSELVSSIGFLIDHPEKREQFGFALRNTIENDFSKKTMVENTLSLYR